jgi:FkbM family methyltransferase
MRPFGYAVRPAGHARKEVFPPKEKEAVLKFVFQALVERLVAERAGSEVSFIQIGAFDGVSNDPLHPFIIAHRWRGVLVEPQTAPFDQLKKNYRGHDQLTFVNAAIGETDGVIDFYVVPEGENLPPRSQNIASLKKDNVLKHRDGLPDYGVRVGIEDIEERVEAVQVETLTFATLVERCGVERLDLLQVDAEGYDARILAQVDFERFHPPIVRYEHMHLSGEEQEATLRLLRGHGYLVVIGFTETLAYIP